MSDNPVCSLCNDTHRMELCDREVPCTHCPTPCMICASDVGRGAYCATTPCTCGCHAVRAAQQYRAAAGGTYATRYDRDTALRLADEAREDDARMTRAPWQAGIGDPLIQADKDNPDGPLDVATMESESLNYDPFGIARTRNNLSEVSRQIAAAVARIDELTPSDAGIAGIRSIVRLAEKATHRTITMPTDEERAAFAWLESLIKGAKQ